MRKGGSWTAVMAATVLSALPAASERSVRTWRVPGLELLFDGGVDGGLDGGLLDGTVYMAGPPVKTDGSSARSRPVPLPRASMEPSMPSMMVSTVP